MFACTALLFEEVADRIDSCIGRNVLEDEVSLVDDVAMDLHKFDTGSSDSQCLHFLNDVTGIGKPAGFV